MQVTCKIHYRWASLVGFLGAYQLGYTKINNHMCSMNYETWSTITCQMSKQAKHYWNQIKLRMTETKKCDLELLQEAWLKNCYCMQLSVQKCCWSNLQNKYRHREST